MQGGWNVNDSPIGQAQAFLGILGKTIDFAPTYFREAAPTHQA